MIINDSIKIVEVSDGTEIFMKDRKIKLRSAQYNMVIKLFSSNNLNLKEEKLKNSIISKFQHEKFNDGYEERRIYNLGNQIILSDDCCESCLALQEPFGSTIKYDLPKCFLKLRNKRINLDEKGIVQIKSLEKISHVKCCPLNMKILSSNLFGKSNIIDEKFLENDLIDRIVTYYEFELKNFWNMKALIFGNYYMFYGLTKAETIEKLYQFILKKFYNYEKLGIGLTVENAFIDYCNYIDLNNILGGRWNKINLNKYAVYKILNMEQAIEESYVLKGHIYVDIFYLQVRTNERVYYCASSDVEICLLEIWSRIKNEKSDRRKLKVDLSRQCKLIKYEDYMSTTYKFIIIGAEKNV